MSSDVVLTAALRNNLLSLQGTQKLIDKTQLRLATGLKVNSALDNPGNYFAAQSLDNRASDLSRLLDGIGQSIKTIDAANNGISALTSLVEQAQSIASSARDELASSEGEARITGTVDLSSTDLVADLGFTTGDTLNLTTVDDNGNQISQSVDIVTGDSAYSLAAKITNAFADNQNGEISASVTSSGFLSIQSSGGRTFKLDGGTEITQAEFNSLGIGDYFSTQTRTDGTAYAASTVVAGSTINSVSLFEGPGNTVDAGDLLGGTSYTDANGNTALSLAAGSSLAVSVTTASGTQTTTAVTGASTFQDFVDSINQDTNVNQLISASFDSATGQLSITSLSDSVQQVDFTSTAAAAGEVVNLGFGDSSGQLDPVTSAAAGADHFIYHFNSSTAALDSLAKDYNNLRDQVDRLVVDASYRGVNLLNGDDLTTFFNEDNTSQLTTSGATFTANGLGLTEATFRSAADIETTATQARTALASVRSFGSSLANNLSIIQTRQDFTKQTINTLKAGSDALTVADQNEEGANLLALQTRQTLGITSLSLASQSQQAVLRLF